MSVGASAAYEVAKAVTQDVAPVVVNATNAEPWYQSRVIRGAIAAIIAKALGIVAQVLALFGIDFTELMEGQAARPACLCGSQDELRWRCTV